jgi:hypothetical protein
MVHRPSAETFTGVGILVVANMAVNGVFTYLFGWAKCDHP